ncbi:DNA polymerase III subunit delta [Candidatus Saccharibacteria bacterium RIFCSPHIGHO2_01_FULL_45_15]|nr:MAG: DNA polymerase III subunit delta [Candidatus Saccharibacteria bacterium RIFCSPHIGHO2_01_FULL_45_15]OGL27909.1 MAG: DNA polymerase III subunit delta [Candidatus Saccharibacteria bacterium RIFCSPHIGHO2_02_FULL_46_12]OGL32701.1 MAG: DNA polymerase III subunit delta [Candidatus Saccharibacteria bacterium RIFCSPHIGHO2_12_FULL_44_22]
MITLLHGENTFESSQALAGIIATFDGDAETIDGSVIETVQLPDLLMGATLFASNRLVIVKNLSENKSVWNDLGEWIPRVSDDVHLVLVDSKLDKRTKTYKELMKVAKVSEFPVWTERDTNKVEQWVVEQATKQGVQCDKKSAQALVARVGVDQWQLYHAIQKLSALDHITPDIIKDVIEANPAENVFNLFDAALRGNRERVHEMVATLKQTDDPYMVFGLLSSQAFQLAALASTDESSGDVAKLIGAHPFALSKLAPYASRIGKRGAKKMIATFADTDTAMKSTAADPWLLVERTLIKVSNIK